MRSEPRSQIPRRSESRVREGALPIRGITRRESVARGWSADQRAVALGGLTLIGILTLLTVTTVRSRVDAYAVPSLQQMVMNARLFDGLLPDLAAFSAGYYALFAWTCVIALWLVYLKLIWHVRGRPLDLRLVAAGAIALGVLAFSVPPIFSTDIFSYAIFGRLGAIYNVNPYLTTANIAAPNDILMPYLYWRDIPSPYGPLWTAVSEALVIGRHLSAFDLVVRFKLVALLAVLVDGWLIYVLVRHHAPAHAAWAYLAFAWNPLVLIEGVIVGHNDVLILTGVLGAAYLLSRARSHLAIAGLTVSALVKYSTVPVLGLATLRLLLRTPPSRRLWLALRLALLVGVVAVAAFLPYWAGMQGLMSTLAEPGRGVNNPLLMLLRELVWLASLGQVWLGTTAMVIVSMVAFGGWQAIWLWRERCCVNDWTLHGELAAWAATLAVFLLLWPRIHTWYFLVPLGIAAAAGPRHRRVFELILVITLISYCSYFA